MNEEGIIYLQNTIKGLAVSGLWDGYHFKSRVKNFIYKTYGNLVFLTFMCFNISQFIEMFNVANDIILLMQNIGVTLLYAVVLLKVYTLHFRQKRISSLLEKIRYAEVRAFKRPKDELEIYYEVMSWSWFVTKAFWSLCVLTLLAFLIARPLEYWYKGPQRIYHNRVPFMYSSWFPFDKYGSDYYPLAYFYQMLSGCLGGYYVAVADTFIVSFLIFGIGQFKMIQQGIRNLHLSVGTIGDDLDVYEQVVELVKHHIRTIEYIEDLDELLNPIMFLNFLICSMIICAVGIEGIMAGESFRIGLSLEYLISLLIEVFNYYWHANEIIVQSTNVGNAVSESQWYRFTPKVKKALIMIMLRSQKPCTLTIGGFYLMSLSTYLMIVRATYSYLALFRDIYPRE